MVQILLATIGKGKPKSNTQEIDLPLLEIDLPLLETDLPFLETDLPLLETDMFVKDHIRKCWR